MSENLRIGKLRNQRKSRDVCLFRREGPQMILGGVTLDDLAHRVHLLFILPIAASSSIKGLANIA